MNVYAQEVDDERNSLKAKEPGGRERSGGTAFHMA